MLIIDGEPSVIPRSDFHDRPVMLNCVTQLLKYILGCGTALHCFYTKLFRCHFKLVVNTAKKLRAKYYHLSVLLSRATEYALKFFATPHHTPPHTSTPHYTTSTPHYTTSTH